MDSSFIVYSFLERIFTKVECLPSRFIVKTRYIYHNFNANCVVEFLYLFHLLINKINSAYRKTGIWDPSRTLKNRKTGIPASPYKKRKTGTLADPSGPYTNPTCCKNILRKQHVQLGFHFLMFFFKT